LSVALVLVTVFHMQYSSCL